MNKPLKIIYLDHAATTPVDPQVIKAMQPFWHDQFGNPSSLYKSGKLASEAVGEARKNISEILNCSPREITFTSGGTESVNLAIQGLARQYELEHKKKGHIITTLIEHHAVLHSVQALAEEGWSVDYAPVDKEGFVKLDALKKLVRKDTVLISVMYANNEIGTIEPIEQIGRWLTGLNKTRQQKIYFHTDACQAAGVLDLDVNKLHVDLMSLNASKIYGPKGIGLLYLRSGIKIRPIIFGGGQERDLRSGTENVPAIIGFATALELAQKNKDKENKREIELLKHFVDRLLKKVKGISINGPKLSSDNFRKTKNVNPHENNLKRLPNNLNLLIDGIEGEAAMLYLDAKGIAIATGSACTTTSADPSHVLEAIGISRKKAYQAIRITIGKETNKNQLNYVLEELPKVIQLLRQTEQE